MEDDMNIWHDISRERITPGDFVATIEISKGSKKKYELDKETGLIILRSEERRVGKECYS